MVRNTSLRVNVSPHRYALKMRTGHGAAELPPRPEIDFKIPPRCGV